MQDRITKKQIQLIHIAKARLGLSDEEYQELIVSMFPDAFAGSCKELGHAQATKLIDHFKSRGFEIKKPRRKRTPKGVAALVTKKQLDEIDRIAADVRWQFSDGLKRFTRKVLGGKERPASTKDAAKLIEALKGLRRTQEKQRAANE